MKKEDKLHFTKFPAKRLEKVQKKTVGPRQLTAAVELTDDSDYRQLMD